MSSDEIADFIRRAAQRRQAGHTPPPQPAPRPMPMPMPMPSQPVQELPAEVEIIEEERPRRLGRLASRDAHLAEEVGLADEKMEEHLHDAFDHKLGDLKADTAYEVNDSNVSGTEAAGTATRRNVSPFAEELIQMMRDKNDVRKAVILNEIFKRPDHFG